MTFIKTNNSGKTSHLPLTKKEYYQAEERIWWVNPVNSKQKKKAKR